jgi:hypothetical protein
VKGLEKTGEICFMRKVARRLKNFAVITMLAGVASVSLPGIAQQADAPVTASATTNVAPGTAQGSPTEQEQTAAPQPIASFTVGDKEFQNVTLSSFDGSDVTFSHAFGIKILPIAAFTKDQVEALNATTDKTFIDISKLDLTPPTPEAVKETDAMVQSAGDVNGLMPNGNTPLIEAVANGRTDIIKVLISRNANVNMADGSGTTPLKEAEARGNEKVIALLKSAGAKHPPKVLPKTPRMVELEKYIQESRAKAKEYTAKAREHASKAESYRSKASQATRALASPTERQKASEYQSKAAFEDANAKSASSTASHHENQAKNWEAALAGVHKEQQAQAEREEQREAQARLQEARQKESAARAPAVQPSASVPQAQPAEPYRDPMLDQMKSQQQQAQAAVSTAQSMVDIMESRTAAEKEIARQAAERKEKLSKVPGYVRYVVWCGIFMYVGGLLWFICMAFYDSMMWGLLCFFFPVPMILVYFIMHPKEMWFSFAMAVFGFLMFWIPMVVYQVGLFDFLF